MCEETTNTSSSSVASTNLRGLIQHRRVWFPMGFNSNIPDSELESKTVLNGIIYLVHGLGEHCECYEDTLVQDFLDNGLMVLSHDHEGHGKSEGDRMYIKDIDDLVTDVFDHLYSILNKFPFLRRTKKFIYGHSLGGLVAIKCVLHEAEEFEKSEINEKLFQFAILDAPCVRLRPIVHNKLTMGLFHFTSKFLPNKMPVLKGNVREITRCEETQKKLKDDDTILTDTTLKLGTAKAIINGMNDLTEASLAKFNLPVLVTQGTNDNITHINGAKLLIKSISSKDKTFITYDGAHHKLISEVATVKDDHRQKIRSWIFHRLS